MGSTSVEMPLGVPGQNIQDDVLAEQFIGFDAGIENGDHLDGRFGMADGVDQIGQEGERFDKQLFEDEIVFRVEQSVGSRHVEAL